MQHAWKHVERPGGSHTALDGKKKQVNQSWVLFKQQAFNATGEDKFYLLSKLQKWASNKSNSSVLFVSLVFGVLFCFLDERDSA